MKRLIIFFLVLVPAFAFAVTPEQLRSQYISEVYKNKLPGDRPSMSEQVNAISKVYGENGNINQTTTTSGSVNGSAASSVSTVSKAASAAAAAGQMAKRYGAGLARGLPQAVVGGLIVQGIVQGVGWLIDEGGKIQKPADNSNICSSDGSDCAYAQYIYVSYSLPVRTYFSSLDALCAATKHLINRTDNCYLFNGTLPYLDNFGGIGQRLNNPNYSSTATPSTSTQPVTQDELAAVLQKYLQDHPNTTITNNFYQAAYSADPANDEAGSLADQISAGIQQGLQDAVKTGSATTNYTDANGQTATINTTINNDGTTVNNNYNTTTNTDGSTTTTGKSDIPAFCEWAKAVCDWFDWTKESPDPEEPQDSDFNDQGIFSKTFNTSFSLPASCPPDIPFSLDNPYLQINDTISLKWLCMIFTFMGYPLVFVSHCIGVWILYEAVIRKEFKVN